MHLHTEELSQHSKLCIILLNEATALKVSVAKVSADPALCKGRALTIKLEVLTPEPLLMHQNCQDPNFVKYFQISIRDSRGGVFSS
jgi:hypothetical protein